MPGQVAIPMELQRMLQGAFNEIRGLELKHERLSAEADPKAHKLTRVMAKSLSYRWTPAGKDGRGRAVYFCWSCHRNVAGYFLGWREVKGGRVTKRDQWIARKCRRRAQELAHRRAERFRAQHTRTETEQAHQ